MQHKSICHYLKSTSSVYSWLHHEGWLENMPLLLYSRYRKYILLCMRLPRGNCSSQSKMWKKTLDVYFLDVPLNIITNNPFAWPNSLPSKEKMMSQLSFWLILSKNCLWIMQISMDRSKATFKYRWCHHKCLIKEFRLKDHFIEEKWGLISGQKPF